MTDSFWHLTGDEPESDAERPGSIPVPYETSGAFAPLQESMRGDRSRPQRAPSTDQKKTRRQIHRSGAHTAMGPAFAETDWDELHPRLKDLADNGEIHRGIGINLPDELHRYVHDDSHPVHERAAALLNHVASENSRKEEGDHRLGLGMHWSLSHGQAEHFADFMADHHAEANKDRATGEEDNAHDFTWGRNPGDVDMSNVKDHLHSHHGIHPHHQPASMQGVQDLHTQLHRGAPPMPGQQALFPEPPRVPKANAHVDLDEFREPDEPRGKPGTSIVLHSPYPQREDIEEHPQGNPNAGGDVYHPEYHSEAEIPIRSGASLPITGISWMAKPQWEDSIHTGDGKYTHHRFDEPEHREARKLATVLPTSVERLNTGDNIRTPTGQTAEVRKVRPHESDSRLIYLDTDQGTSTVTRGTNMQVVPRNSQQQELPDTGKPMGGGNAGTLPGQGSGPGGMEAQEQQTKDQPCPNCGQASLNLRGGQYMCTTCGFQVQSGNTPGNLLFGDKPHGYMPGRKAPGEIPTARMWASKYRPDQQGSQIARRARQVLGGEQ